MLQSSHLKSYYRVLKEIKAESKRRNNLDFNWSYSFLGQATTDMNQFSQDIRWSVVVTSVTKTDQKKQGYQGMAWREVWGLKFPPFPLV